MKCRHCGLEIKVGRKWTDNHKGYDHLTGNTFCKNATRGRINDLTLLAEPEPKETNIIKLLAKIDGM